MKKFINISELRLQRVEMEKIIGGGSEVGPISVKYGILKYGIQPLYGIKYGIQPLYGILRYGIIIDPATTDSVKN